MNQNNSQGDKMENLISWLLSLNVVVPVVFLALVAIGLFCCVEFDNYLDRKKVVKRAERIVANM